ncbi:MAG: DNA-binding response regulator [Chitinophagales bacterium]|nr:MAG: DNA-binding response regulator [Chitinophagales bacterium]
MIKVVLCDDHQIVRQGLRQLLLNDKDITVTAEFSSGEDLLHALKTLEADVILLDISLPGRSGIDTLHQIKLSLPQLHVLVLSMYPQEQFAIRTIKAGADGYLHKDSSPQELSLAIKQIAAGGKYVSPNLMPLLFAEIGASHQNHPPHLLLSDREMDVLLKLGQGKRVGEIAQELSLSIKTVSTYKKRILTKLKVNTYNELVTYLHAHALLEA